MELSSTRAVDFIPFCRVLSFLLVFANSGDRLLALGLSVLLSAYSAWNYSTATGWIGMKFYIWGGGF